MQNAERLCSAKATQTRKELNAECGMRSAERLCSAKATQTRGKFNVAQIK